MADSKHMPGGNHQQHVKAGQQSHKNSNNMGDTGRITTPKQETTGSNRATHQGRRGETRAGYEAGDSSPGRPN